MRKTKDEEILDDEKAEKKPTTRKKTTTAKSSTTSKTTKTKKTNSDETSTKNTASSNSKKSTATKKVATKSKTEKNSEKSTVAENIIEESKPKTKKTTSKSNTSSTKKTSTSSKTKTTESVEKTKTTKSTTTRKSQASSKADVLEKDLDNSTYINPDILKFEERLKKIKTTSADSKIEKNDETLDLEELEKDITSNAIEEPQISTSIKKEKKLTNESEKTSLEKVDKKKKKKFNVNYIYNTIIAICIILILYSVINIILWQKNNIDNSNLIKQVSEITPVTETSSVVINENLQIEKKSYDFTELSNQNPDTVGWIHLNNTDIDYPVVKAADNDFYLTHAFDKSYNAAGWIYADYRNRCDDTDTNLIIYGHNRLNDNMFGTLENVLSNPWLADENNHYIHYSSINKSHIYSIFSAFICNSDESVNYLRTGFASNKDFTQYINDLKNLSSYDFNVNLTENDKIITLYTCHGLNNERLIVCGKLIN